jgi:AraC-like DNA-binding protein
VNHGIAAPSRQLGYILPEAQQFDRFHPNRPNRHREILLRTGLAVTSALRELASAISAPRNRLISTTDLGEWDARTRETLQTAFRFEVAKGARFTGEIHHVDLGAFAIGRRRFGAETWAQSAPIPEDSFTVVLPFGGRCTATLGAHPIGLSGGFGSMASSKLSFWCHASSDFDHAFLQVGRPRIERVCATLIGRHLSQPLDFAFGLSTTSPAHARFIQAMTMAASLTEGPALFPLLTANLEQLVMGMLLLAQPNNYTDALSDPHAFVSTVRVRRAMEYMEAHIDEPLTVTEVAHHVGVGLRCLQAAFRSHFGTTPSMWLRDRRLDRVHEALVRAVPGSTSVTRVALEWGFVHLGEFAAYYRRRFGVSPSDTLAKRH